MIADLEKLRELGSGTFGTAKIKGLHLDGFDQIELSLSKEAHISIPLTSLGLRPGEALVLLRIYWAHVKVRTSGCVSQPDWSAVICGVC
nr:hypothetical protein [Tanacetum cinerariifolium]